MLSFRQKILIAYLLVFLLFLGAMFPFATHSIKKIVTKAILERTTELITKIQSASDDDTLIQQLKDQKFLIFFRISVITDERKVLYDSYTKRLLGTQFDRKYIVNHPEVEEAFKSGIGYGEDYSKLLNQKFAYMAKAFPFHGKTYVMRTAFPYAFIADMTNDFIIGFLTLSTAVLLLFSLMTWFIIHYLTQPIHQIIKAIRPYQEGLSDTIPKIKIKTATASDDFGKLAETLNYLSIKVQSQIQSLTEERNEKKAVLESLIEGVIAVNDQMIITYANQTASKLLHIKQKDLEGNHFTIIEQPICHKILTECQQEKKVLTETLQQKQNGIKTYLDIIAAPKNADKGAILVIQDKSAHYKLLDMRKEFIANASHELKTPITIIRGFAETLQDNPNLPEETTIKVMAKIVNNCQRMTTLIKDLLALSDIENIPSSRLIECDLHDIVNHCSQTIKEIFPQANITIQNLSNQEITLIADPNLMEMAVMNLIENAAKYSNQPAHITITLEKDSKWVKLIIADQGIGIPEADVEHIFQRFYTVNKAHSKKLGGSGLGLSIVETIIEKHFGKISVTSELGKGTTFTVLLPVSEM